MKSSLLIPLFLLFIIRTSAQQRECQTLKAWQQFKEMKKSGSRSINPVPVLASEIILPTTHFEIHYTNVGVDAAPPLDADANLIPDLIDTIISTAEYVYGVYQSAGFMMPPPTAIGNDSFKYDIYVGNLGANTYGITVPYEDIGNNPSSPETETHSVTSYLALRNEYTLFTPSANPSADLEVTIAHEFSHAIDFGYNFYISYWLGESRAVFEESVVYPNIPDNFQYFPDILSTPDVALNLDFEDHEAQHKNHFYGAWMFHRYIADHFDTNYLKPVLDASRLDSVTSYTREAVRINESFIYNHETTLKEQFSDFTIANYFFTGDNTYAPYTYANGNAYRNAYGGSVRIEGNRNFTGTPTVWNSVSWGNSVLMRLSSDYISVTSNQNFSVRLTTEGKDTSYNMIVIKIDSVHHQYEFERVGWYHDTICAANIRDYSKWNYFLVIVNRYDYHNTDTNSKQYEITIDKPLQFLNWWIPNTPFGSATTNVAVDKNNLLWVGSGLTEFRYDAHDGNGPHTVGGVTSFNGYYWNHHHYYNSRREPNTLQFPDVINDIGVSSDNHKWFSDANAGFFEYNLQKWKVYDNDTTQPSSFGNPHQSFYWGAKMDVENGASPVVAATGLGLVSAVNGNAVVNSSVPDVNTTCVRIHNGNTYVGANSGLYVLGGTSYNSANGLPADAVTDIEFDHANNMWVGTYTGGIGVYNGTGWTVYDAFHPSSGYLGNRINDIAVDDSGTVWVASPNGISRFKNNYWHIYSPSTTSGAFPANEVYDIAFDKSGCLFLATDHGIVYFCDTTDNTAPVAVNDLKTDFTELKLFPNPANDIISIYANGSLFAENNELKVYDMNGALIKSFINTSNTNFLKMDVTDLMSGVYFIEIKNARAKFVKM